MGEGLEAGEEQRHHDRVEEERLHHAARRVEVEQRLPHPAGDIGDHQQVGHEQREAGDEVSEQRLEQRDRERIEQDQERRETEGGQIEDSVSLVDPPPEREPEQRARHPERAEHPPPTRPEP